MADVQERITPEMAIEAFKANNLTPMTGEMKISCYACAIGAILVNSGVDPSFSNAYNRFGFDYSWGFMNGFDKAQFREGSDEYKLGYEDGTKVGQSLSDAGYQNIQHWTNVIYGGGE